jgi:methyl-accepting chemotaxis protein
MSRAETRLRVFGCKTYDGETAMTERRKLDSKFAPPPVARTTREVASPPRSGISLKQMLFAASGFMAVLILVLASILVRGALIDRANAKRINEINAVGDQLLASARHWAVERGTTFAALNSSEPAGSNAINSIRENRAKGDETYRQAIEAITKKLALPGLETQISDSHGKFDALLALRARVDAALAVTEDRRDPEVAKAFMPAATGNIMSATAVRGGASRQATELDGMIAALLEIKHFAWVAGEFAGRERARINAAIAGGEMLDAATLALLHGNRGQVDLAWGRVKAQVGAASTPAALKTAVAEAEQKFFRDFEPVRAEGFKAGQSDGKYPVTADRWFAAASDAINSILRVVDVGSDTAEAYAHEIDENATHDLLLDGSLMILGILVAVGTFWITSARVVRLIVGMTGTMTALARGRQGGRGAVARPA